MIGAFALFEIGNLAATLLILRAIDLLSPAHGLQSATQIALGLYTAYNVAATVVSFPAGKISDRLGDRGPLLVAAAGVVTAGAGIGCAETAEHAAVAALAPEYLRGSAFGLLCTVASPTVAFGYVAVCMAFALAVLARARTPGRSSI
ncbi:hypothetical protein GCM10022222_37120 [Amycolatopsis ultiminotia]|uniref:Major facilitator superfamily (MFS) profile domain-containing protein n=1 Tax=Amycolatopsis ultiminotia TaxID=543629 RepID=A0ABP6WH11_9PSEU